MSNEKGLKLQPLQVAFLLEASAKYSRQIAHVSPVLRGNMIKSFEKGLYEAASILAPEMDAVKMETPEVSSTNTGTNEISLQTENKEN